MAGRKPGSLVRCKCVLCSTVELSRGTGGNYRCQKCRDAGLFSHRRIRGDWLGKDCAAACVHSHIKSGLLPHPSTLNCADCGCPAREYEHRDYNKPLMVVPICRGCNLRRGPAIPLNGSISRLVRRGHAPYRLRLNAYRVFALLGLPKDLLMQMPAKLTHAHWVQLLPLFEQVSESTKSGGVCVFKHDRMVVFLSPKGIVK